MGLRVLVCVAGVVAYTQLTGSGASATGARVVTRWPIDHVVFMILENHSFDNVLGAWCVKTRRCDGTTTGTLPGGASYPLTDASDVVSEVDHTTQAMQTAVDGGKMDGFADLTGCAAAQHYACLTQYQPAQIPNVISLAKHFAVSDMTFEDGDMASWSSHLAAVTTGTDGFVGGGVPFTGPEGALGPGWGCDSGDVQAWESPTGSTEKVPSCIPDYGLNATEYPYGGAYRATPVKHVPTIMDELSAAGLSWRIYAGLGGIDNTNGYGWAICPTFADCIDTDEATNMVANTDVVTDAESGNLPDFSVVTPTQSESEHNADSMLAGDNWIGQVLSAIEHGPDWRSTAVFVTWDDCGCFYDHVDPPGGDGLRVPMLIASPYAIRGHDDHTVATFDSVLRFTEEDFGLPALSSLDADAYDYSGSFDFSHPRLQPVKMTTTRISPVERRYLVAHPPDPRDPT